MSQMIQSDPLLTSLNWFNISKFALPNIIYLKFKYWLRSNFCGAAAVVSVLVFGNKVLRYTILTVLITFFMDDSNGFEINKAARYVILKDVATGSFGIAVAYMSEAQFSHFKMIGSSILSTIAGLLLFFLNLILWGRSGPLYIIGMLLLAAGEAGLIFLLNEFLASQVRGHEQNTNIEGDQAESPPADRMESPMEDREEAQRPDQKDARREAQRPDQEHARREDRVKARTRVWWNFAWVSSVIATFVISNYSWKVIFFTLTLMFVGIFILFLFGKRFYHSNDSGGNDSSGNDSGGNGSSIFNFIPVLKASLLNQHLNDPSSPDQFHENDRGQLHLSPQFKILRWLDKAAIKEDQKRTGPLCTVRQVEESKHLLKMIPMWSTFLVVSLVSSTGDTFSSEQGKNLDHTDFTFYIVYFGKAISKAAVSFLYKKLLNPNRGSNAQQKLGKIVRIGFGMVLGTIFCVVAWRVEVHRLQIVHLEDNMSIFWLAPQYCLLGLMEGSSTDGLDEFMTGELPNSLHKFASAMNSLVIDGLGGMCSILFMRANHNLFVGSLNESRLDKYYKRLLLLSFLNTMFWYCPISILYQPVHFTRADTAET